MENNRLMNESDLAWSELDRLLKQKRVLSKEAQLCQKMAEHAEHAYSPLEEEHTTPEFRRRLTGRD